MCSVAGNRAYNDSDCRTKHGLLDRCPLEHDGIGVPIIFGLPITSHSSTAAAAAAASSVYHPRAQRVQSSTSLEALRSKHVSTPVAATFEQNLAIHSQPMAH